MIASSGVETEIRALGTRFVAIFRFREICDVDYNLSSKIIQEGFAHSADPFSLLELLSECKFSSDGPANA